MKAIKALLQSMSNPAIAAAVFVLIASIVGGVEALAPNSPLAIFLGGAFAAFSVYTTGKAKLEQTPPASLPESVLPPQVDINKRLGG